MLADYFTKPLQGSLFVRLRNHIMGGEFEDGNPRTPRSVLGGDGIHTTTEASKQTQTVSRQCLTLPQRHLTERRLDPTPTRMKVILGPDSGECVCGVRGPRPE